MKKILGGKENVCPYCQGTMVYLQVSKYIVMSQCKKCGCMVNGRMRDEIKIYTYEVENEK
jgi:hypothetical protein